MSSQCGDCLFICKEALFDYCLYIFWIAGTWKKDSTTPYNLFISILMFQQHATVLLYWFLNVHFICKQFSKSGTSSAKIYLSRIHCYRMFQTAHQKSFLTVQYVRLHVHCTLTLRSVTYGSKNMVTGILIHHSTTTLVHC